MPWGDIAAFVLVVAGGLLSSWLAGRILPLQHIPEKTEELAALDAKYRRWRLVVMSAWLVLLPAASVAAWRLLTRLAAARRARLGPAEIAFFPGGIEFGFPAVFLAAVISIVLLWIALRIYLGSRYAEYRRYETLQWGIGKWTPWLSLIALSAGSSLLAVGLLDCYAIFAADRIRINEFLSAGERTYSYEDVRAIRTAPRWVALVGNEVERREYVFCFRDGRSWNSAWAPGVVSQRDRRHLAELVSAKSEVPIVELSVLTRKDQSCRYPADEDISLQKVQFSLAAGATP